MTRHRRRHDCTARLRHVRTLARLRSARGTDGERGPSSCFGQVLLVISLVVAAVFADAQAGVLVALVLRSGMERSDGGGSALLTEADALAARPRRQGRSDTLMTACAAAGSVLAGSSSASRDTRASLWALVPVAVVVPRRGSGRTVRHFRSPARRRFAPRQSVGERWVRLRSRRPGRRRPTGSSPAAHAERVEARSTSSSSLNTWKGHPRPPGATRRRDPVGGELSEGFARGSGQVTMAEGRSGCARPRPSRPRGSERQGRGLCA